MTRSETVEYLKVSNTTLWKLTSKGALSSYGIGNRRYYNKKEIIDYLQNHRLNS